MAAIRKPSQTTRDVFEQQVAVAQSVIGRGGKVSIDDINLLQKKMAMFGQRRPVPSSKTLMGIALPGKRQPKSVQEVIGDAPEGFGNVLTWEDEDEELAVLVFLNPADSYGLMIRNVNRGDTIEVLNASGIASFSEDTKNDGVAGIIGIVGVGAGIAATGFGAPELGPLIGAATEFAKEQWKEEKVKTKRRDPFGVDPGTQHKAKQEGGVLICMPASRGPIYSGNSSSKEFWIKEPGDRVPANYPPQVENAFFLSRKNRTAVSTADGSIIILAWDHKFEDNLGFYRLEIVLKRRSGKGPVIT